MLNKSTEELCNASARGDLFQVNVLLQGGARVNGRSQYNRTALQVVMMGKSALVKALLVAGADSNLRDPFLNLTPAHDAAREGFLDTVHLLMEHGADVNLVDDQGNLPLHLAAREGHLEVIKLLITHTANPRAANGLGQTPPQLARDCNKVEIAEFIEEFLNYRE